MNNPKDTKPAMIIQKVMGFDKKNQFHFLYLKMTQKKQKTKRNIPCSYTKNIVYYKNRIMCVRSILLLASVQENQGEWRLYL